MCVCHFSVPLFERHSMRPMSAKSDASSSEVMGKPVLLQKQVSYKEFRQDKMERIQRAGAAGKLDG